MGKRSRQIEREEPRKFAKGKEKDWRFCQRFSPPGNIASEENSCQVSQHSDTKCFRDPNRLARGQASGQTSCPRLGSQSSIYCKKDAEKGPQQSDKKCPQNRDRLAK